MKVIYNTINTLKKLNNNIELKKLIMPNIDKFINKKFNNIFMRNVIYLKKYHKVIYIIK